MKKTIIFIATAILILSFAACSSPAIQETPTQPTEAASPTLAPTIEPTAAPTPTPLPSPTPEPTLSPEELEMQANTKEAEQLLHYWETYNDIYALFQVYDMIDEGKLTDDILLGVDQEPWDQFPRPSEGYYYEKMAYMNVEMIYNGRAEDYNEPLLDNAFRYAQWMTEQGIGYISAFDTQESRDRVENGIITIENYFANPSEENLEKFEEMYFDESNLPGEIMYYFAYIEYAPNALSRITRKGKTYKTSEYKWINLPEYAMSMGDHLFDNDEILMEMNQTTNPEDYVPKDWLTPEKIQQLLSGYYTGLSWPSDKLPEYIPEMTGVTVTNVSEDGAIIGLKGITDQIVEEYIEALVSYGWELTSTFDGEGLHAISAANANGETIDFQWDEVSGNGGFGYNQQ